MCMKQGSLNLEQYIGQHFRRKTIVLVGNARFQRDRSAMIDAHDIVIRFNCFDRNGFKEQLCGRCMTHWCVNLDTGRKSKTDHKQRDQLCHEVRVINPEVVVLTPFQNDKHNRLPDVVRYYSDRGLPLSFPHATLRHPLTLRKRQHPSVGFYMGYHLLVQELPITIVGFTGETSKWHDGPQEVRFLQEQDLVCFHPMDD